MTMLRHCDLTSQPYILLFDPPISDSIIIIIIVIIIIIIIIINLKIYNAQIQQKISVPGHKQAKSFAIKLQCKENFIE